MRLFLVVVAGFLLCGAEQSPAEGGRGAISISTYLNSRQLVIGGRGHYSLEDSIEAVALYVVDSRGEVYHRWCGHQDGEVGNWGEIEETTSPCLIAVPREGRYWVHAKAWDVSPHPISSSNHSFRSRIKEILLTPQPLWRLSLPHNP